MRRLTPFILVALGLITVLFLFFGENSYRNIASLRRSLTQQRQKNIELQDKVDNLKRDIYGLQNDPRALEKAARNELGMARPNEQIYLFENEKNK